jgi:acetyl-CoA carboxylase carboxyltransferase component
VAEHFELDDVIDPAETRAVVSSTFAAASPARGRATGVRQARSRGFIDTW